MIAMTLSEIASVVGGSVDGDPEVVVSGPASIDSREVPSDGLFLAVVGEHVDGHDYAAGAVAAGAAAVLGSRPTGVPTVVVDDPVIALGRLAAHVIGALPDTKVIALTGSQGKTGTKDYLAQVLATAAPTVATAGNHNNEIGVPLTVLKATPDTRFLVLEMGARGIGHVAYLCDIARPRVAAVLNVGTAHVGEFGSREAIAVAKGEILEALPADGVAVVNADDPLTREMGSRTDAPVISFGQAGDVSWTEASYDDLDRPTATFRYAGQAVTAALRQVGEHQLVQRCRGGRARPRGGAGVRRDRGSAGRGRRPVEMADGAARERRRGRRTQRLLQRQPGVDARGGRRAGHDRGAARRPHHRRTRRDA